MKFLNFIINIFLIIPFFIGLIYGLITFGFSWGKIFIEKLIKAIQHNPDK